MFLFSYKNLFRNVVSNVARGQKTPPEVIFKVMASYAVTDNPEQTARALNLPPTTVRGIIDRCEDLPEFVELRDKTREHFAERATSIINKALNRLEDEIETKDDIPINHLVVAVGTLYDKRALAEGSATDNVSVQIKLPEGIDEYAG